MDFYTVTTIFLTVATVLKFSKTAKGRKTCVLEDGERALKLPITFFRKILKMKVALKAWTDSLSVCEMKKCKIISSNCFVTGDAEWVTLVRQNGNFSRQIKICMEAWQALLGATEQIRINIKPTAHKITMSREQNDDDISMYRIIHGFEKGEWSSDFSSVKMRCMEHNLRDVSIDVYPLKKTDLHRVVIGTMTHIVSWHCDALYLSSIDSRTPENEIYEKTELVAEYLKEAWEGVQFGLVKEVCYELMRRIGLDADPEELDQEINICVASAIIITIPSNLSCCTPPTTTHGARKGEMDIGKSGWICM
ncbi:unnamed protein product [Owenia fusiformis]|uniref:Uncharacterized protein n=1 Tax=Owenia fusiformis TaxID=6347 RepID=A0A8J1Y6Y9_OWEFU|nr:unnamed protein product [Owenia fusiformis]